jgi:UPF0755 protein
MKAPAAWAAIHYPGSNDMMQFLGSTGFRKGFVVFLCAVLLAAAAAVGILFVPFHDPPIETDIPKGSGAAAVARALEKSGAIRSATAFHAAVRLLGVSRRLKPGRYQFEGSLSNYQIIRAIVAGRVKQEAVTIPEGLTCRRIAGILARDLGMDTTAFLSEVRDPALLRRLGIDAPTLEGYLFPDTYRIPSDAEPRLVVSEMVARLQEVFSDSLKARAADLNLTPHQALTLASIIEGETVLDSERPVVSAVYHNRLRRGMALQACPTIQYLIADGPRRLLNGDLRIPSPYNTYLHPGLPPGPVNNPGKASILAALHPAPVQYMYLVANGDGSHTFSTNLADHNAAKRRLERIRRQLRTRAG